MRRSRTPEIEKLASDTRSTIGGLATRLYDVLVGSEPDAYYPGWPRRTRIYSFGDQDQGQTIASGHVVHHAATYPFAWRRSRRVELTVGYGNPTEAKHAIIGLSAFFGKVYTRPDMRRDDIDDIRAYLPAEKQMALFVRHHVGNIVSAALVGGALQEAAGINTSAERHRLAEHYKTWLAIMPGGEHQVIDPALAEILHIQQQQSGGMDRPRFLPPAYGD